MGIKYCKLSKIKLNRSKERWLRETNWSLHKSKKRNWESRTWFRRKSNWCKRLKIINLSNWKSNCWKRKWGYKILCRQRRFTVNSKCKIARQRKQLGCNKKSGLTGNVKNSPLNRHCTSWLSRNNRLRNWSRRSNKNSMRGLEVMSRKWQDSWRSSSKSNNCIFKSRVPWISN